MVIELPWQNASNEKEILRLKEEFISKRQWDGILPTVFQLFVSYVFGLGFDEDVDPNYLMLLLMQMNSQNYEYQFSFFDASKIINIEDFYNNLK